MPSILTRTCFATMLTYRVAIVQFNRGKIMERVIDVTADRRQFGTLLDEVFHKGDAVTVVRKGKPMARIVPVALPSSQEGQISEQQRALLDELDSLPALAMDDEPTELLRTMRKQKRKQAGKEYGC